MSGASAMQRSRAANGSIIIGCDSGAKAEAASEVVMT